MRWCTLAMFLFMSTVALAIPALEQRSQFGVTLAVPAGWKMLVTADEHNVTMSRDAFTQIVLHWFAYKDGVDRDKVLDKLVSVTNANLKVGTVTEVGRRDILGGRGRVAEANWAGPLGYSLKLGFSVVLDPSGGRIVSAVFFTSPEGWTELGGNSLLEQVSGGLSSAP